MPGRARFPACSPLGTVEPPILEFANARLLESDKPWSAQRMPLVMDRVRNRLGQLSPRLGEADWLDGAFSAGDLMMVSVLLRLRASPAIIRGYGHDNWIRYETGEVVPGEELPNACHEILSNADIAYMHIRSKFNCFQCRVDRG